MGLSRLRVSSISLSTEMFFKRSPLKLNIPGGRARCSYQIPPSLTANPTSTMVSPGGAAPCG
jgi:hypothetical protein